MVRNIIKCLVYLFSNGRRWMLYSIFRYILHKTVQRAEYISQTSDPIKQNYYNIKLNT